jgi:hypothetical protein
MRIRAGFAQFVAAGLLMVGVALLANGCGLLAIPAIEKTGSLIGPAGTGVSSVVGTDSTAAVNDSWTKNNDAQAQYYREQMLALSRQRQQEVTRRAASVGILKSMATLDHDPQMADLAEWVEAGGDPQFALDYGLAKEKDDAARSRAVRILEDMSEKQDDPVLYELARWVRAGGDQNFALNYALSQGAKIKASGREGSPPERSQGQGP